MLKQAILSSHTIDEVTKRVLLFAGYNAARVVLYHIISSQLDNLYIENFILPSQIINKSPTVAMLHHTTTKNKTIQAFYQILGKFIIIQTDAASKDMHV